ncbi:MAG: formyl transferase [Hyphomicrobiales bacterium]|nr:formyl transferase [Hyphomicrobiales bacterium]
MSKHVLLLLPADGLQRWHGALARRIAADGARLSWRMVATPERPTASLRLLEQLESLLYARGLSGATAALEPASLPPAAEGVADCVVDLAGGLTPGALTPLFDGRPEGAARDAALLEGRAPHLALALPGADGWRIVAEASPALERPGVLEAGREAVAARLVTLIRQAVRNGPQAGRLQPPRPAPEGRAPLAYGAGALAARIAGRLRKIVAHEGHWRVGWRACPPGAGALERRAWPSGAVWSWLPDDGARYYADPFLFEEAGKTWLFLEEFPYATGKAVISVCEMGADGRAGPPQIVLERPCHLSYPLVFRAAGQIWMMPETSGAGTLELYRADPFPHRWVLDRTLIEGQSIADATFFEADGSFWLTAATAEDEGSSWDCLSLWRGPSPLGPWTRCGEGPVLVDVAAARPAGRVARIGGELWRPAQDCSAGYGSGLSLCRIDRLGANFAQTIAARLAPPPGAPAQGVHTLNTCGGFETIDAVGPRIRTISRS